MLTVATTPIPFRIDLASVRDGDFGVYVMDTDDANQTNITNNHARRA